MYDSLLIMRAENLVHRAISMKYIICSYIFRNLEIHIAVDACLVLMVVG